MHKKNNDTKTPIRFAQWKKKTPQIIAEQHKKLTPNNSGTWGKALISDCDSSKNIVYEYSWEQKEFGGAGIDTENSIVFGYEPRWVRVYPNCKYKKRLHFNDGKCWMPQNWMIMIRLSYDELLNLKIKKEKNLSIILSNKKEKTGHIIRHKIVEDILSKECSSLDIWGKYKNKEFEKNCKGPPDGPLGNEGQTKGIEPYRYYLSIENGAGDFYFSEKITIPYLFLTMPFYWGCKKIDKFFPKESYIQINPDKKGEAERIIELSKSPIREENIEYLKEAKSLVMNKYNSMATIDMALRSDNLIRDFC